MKFFRHGIIYSSLLLIFVLSGVCAAQEARISFDNLNKLEDRASDVVEVTLDGKLLETAKRALTKVNDKDARTVGKAISGLKGIYVRVYNFEKDNEYNLADIDQIRNQLRSSAWEKIVNVRSKRDNQKVDVFTKFAGEMMDGIAVVVSESKSVAVINVVGAIDLDTLVEISGRMNIPKIEIERETAKTPNND